MSPARELTADCISGDCPGWFRLLICPVCLRRDAVERHLSGGKLCEDCGTVFPVVDGVPVLRAGIDGHEQDEQIREAFYETVNYHRSAIEGSALLERSLAIAPKDGIVLEIGSGAGVFSDCGAGDYCGLDYSLASLVQHLAGKRRICASAECVPLPAQSCRFIFSFATLEHVPEVDRAFEEIHRLLMPGAVAVLGPAWHCRDWAAEGLPVRAYGDLTARQKLRKALIPLRDLRAYRAAAQIPWRMWRRLRACLNRGPTQLVYRRLHANYEKFWMSDSDACSSIDSHEAILFFRTRFYEVLRPGDGWPSQLLADGSPVVVRKAARGPEDSAIDGWN